MYWLAHKNEQDTCRVLEDDLGSDPNLENSSQEDHTLCYDNTNHASGVVVKYVLFHYLHTVHLYFSYHICWKYENFYDLYAFNRDMILICGGTRTAKPCNTVKKSEDYVEIPSNRCWYVLYR